MPVVIGKTCPYCQYPIKPGAPVTTCSHCSIPHHEECWDYNGGCTTYGCSGTHSVPAASAARTSGLGVVDLTDIMSEPERPTLPNHQVHRIPPRVDPTEPPLVTAAHKVAEASGAIGAIAGFIVGIGAGGIGCIPGALLGLLIGVMIGSVLLYLFIVAATAGIGYMIAASGGPDAASVGLWIGIGVGVVIIAIGCSKRGGG